MILGKFRTKSGNDLKADEFPNEHIPGTKETEDGANLPELDCHFVK